LIFYVYAIESLSANRIYIGHTQDIESRLKYHNSGYVKSTKGDRPWSVLAYEKIGEKKEARWLERSLKKSRGRRLKWIGDNLVKK
jgi:putative endonuclease